MESHFHGSSLPAEALAQARGALRAWGISSKKFHNFNGFHENILTSFFSEHIIPLLTDEVYEISQD
jgi:hypothetical protein